MACAINCAASPACSSSVRWPRGDPILPLSRPDSAYQSASIPRPPLPRAAYEIADLDAMIAAIVDELAPNLVARIRSPYRRCPASPYGRRHPKMRSSQLRIAMRRQPVPASSEDRQASAQSWRDRAAIARCTSSLSVACDRSGPRTTSLATRQGHSKLDAIRALKRYLPERSSRSSRSAASTPRIPYTERRGTDNDGHSHVFRPRCAFHSPL